MAQIDIGDLVAGLAMAVGAVVLEGLFAAEQIGARGVLRRGWAPLSDDCMPEPGDEVFALE